MTVEVIAAIRDDSIGATNPFPSVTVAHCNRDGCMYRIVDCQMQGIDLRTTMGIRMTVEVVAAIRDDSVGAASPFPSVALTFHNCDGCVYGVVNSQVQRIHLRAAVGIRMTVEVVAAIRDDSVSATNPFPSVALTILNREGRVHRVVDRQVQRIHLRTAVGILMAVEVVTTLRDDSIGAAFPFPSVALTFLNREGSVHRIVDRQVQGIHLRAAMSIQMAVGVVAACGVSLTVTICPSIASASLNREGSVLWFVNRQSQCNHGIASRRIGQRVGRVRSGRLGVSVTVPGEGFAGGGCSVTGCRKFHLNSSVCRIRTTSGCLRCNDGVRTVHRHSRITTSRVLSSGVETTRAIPIVCHSGSVRGHPKFDDSAQTGGHGCGRSFHRAADVMDGGLTRTRTSVLVLHRNGVSALAETRKGPNCLEGPIVERVSVVAARRRGHRKGTLLLSCDTAGVVHNGELRICRQRVNGQMQRIHLRTVIRIQMAVEVGAALRDSSVGAVNSFPRVGATALLVADSRMLRVVDCQMQGHHRVATRRVHKRVSQCLSRGRNARMFVPVESLARRG